MFFGNVNASFNRGFCCNAATQDGTRCFHRRNTLPVERSSRCYFSINCNVKSSCAVINVGCDIARLNVCCISGLKIDGLPNTACPFIPTDLFSRQLFAVILCIIRTHDDNSRFPGCKCICDVKFKREVAVFVFADAYAIYPYFCVPVHCTECQNRPFLAPCFWNRYRFAVPSDSMSGCFAIITAAFNAAAGNLFRRQIRIFAQIVFVICLFFFSPCCKAFPGVGDLYLRPFGVGG